MRPDGNVVGTGADISTGRELQSGIWQSADGKYPTTEIAAWTGALNEDNCGNWTSGSSTLLGTYGQFAMVTTRGGAVAHCLAPSGALLYCVQTGP